MQRIYSSLDVREKIFKTIDNLRASNADFAEAYDTYVSQYGKEKLVFGAPLNLADTVDPVALVAGRNCIVLYLDSSKTIKGSLGSLKLREGEACIIGRKEPQDSILMGWSSSGEQVGLEEYNSRVGTIPSRVHCALTFLAEGQVIFSDLGSSSGSVVLGDRPRSGQFVRVYDPGRENAPAIKFEREFTSGKA